MTELLRNLIFPVLIASVFLMAAGCDNGAHFLAAVDDLRERAFPASGGAVAGEAGDISLKENELYYANAAYGVSGPEQIGELSESARRLVIQKLLLRRMAIDRGRVEGYYGSEEAARYIVPRIEKILEEYYYHRAGRFDEIYREAERLKPDDEALRELAQSDPQLRGKNISEEQMRRERDALIRRIARRRTELARQKVIDELIRSSPPIQVHGTSSGQSGLPDIQ